VRNVGPDGRLKAVVSFLRQFRSFQQSNQFLNRPDVIRQARFHGWRDAQRFMDGGKSCSA